MSGQGPFDTREFRSALGSFATGVTIVTARGPDGTLVGVTANSFNSVSLNPPMVLWSLAKTARSFAAFQAAGHWAVHILAADQDELSNRFARAGEDKFSGLETDSGAGSVPLLRHCASRFQCKTAFMYEGGDHLIFVGEVVAFDHNDVAPLVYHAGKYALAARKTEPTTLSGAAPRDSDVSYGEDFLGYLLWRAHVHFQNQVVGHLREHGLDEDSFMILARLLHRNGRTPEQLSSGMLGAGSKAIGPKLAALSQRGLLRNDDHDGKVWLSDAGRDVILRIHAASKAIEADQLGRMEPSEALAFKHLLRRFIVQTNGGLPHPWEDGG